MYASCWKTRISTPFRSPLRTTGIRCSHLGLSGRQGCVRREAVLVQHVRGEADCRGRPRYDRIVQEGSQSRSSPALQEAVQKMRDGFLGDVYMARGPLFQVERLDRPTPVEPVPAGVHYDLWLGPAPSMRSRATGSITTGTGSGITATATSAIRVSMKSTSPAGAWVSVSHESSRLGGHFMFKDDQETPDTLNCSYEFDDNGKTKMMVFEVRHWMSNHEAGIGEHGKKKDPNTIGNLFYGSKGYMAIDGYTEYQTWMERSRARADGEARRQPFCELHPRPHPEPRRTERGNRGRRRLHLARSPGEHLLPPGARTAFRSRYLYSLATKKRPGYSRATIVRRLSCQKTCNPANVSGQGIPRPLTMA